jgi:DNA-binding transcriptional LysR family regulator
VCREGVREAVLAGFGVGITTEIEYVPDGRTRMLRIVDADIFTEAFAVCLRERRSYSVIRAFMATAEEFFDRGPRDAAAPKAAKTPKAVKAPKAGEARKARKG